MKMSYKTPQKDREGKIGLKHMAIFAFLYLLLVVVHLLNCWL